MRSLFFLFLACLWAQACLARRGLNAAIGDVKRILVPHHPPGHDADILDHLLPKPGHSLFFRESATKGIGAAFGQMNATFIHPTVLLDHSSHVSGVHCSKSGLKVCFRDESSLSQAAQTWQSHLTPFLLSPFHRGCGKHHEGQRSYFQFRSMAPASDARCTDVQATEVPAEDAMEKFDLDFGHEEGPEKSDLRRRDDGALLIASQETIDISDSEVLLSEFFGVEWNTTYPDGAAAATPVHHNGTVETTKRSNLHHRRSHLHRRLWGPFQAIVDVAEATANVIVDAGNAVADAAVSTYNAVVDFGNNVGKLVQDALNYEWSLGASISRSWDIGGAGTQAVPTNPGLFGEGEGLAISANGLIPGDIQCENCYARGDVSVAGHIGWTLNDGLKTGYLQVGGEWDSRLALAFQITGQAKVEAFKKNLLRKNLVNLEIPGVIAIGPEITLGVVFDIYFQAQTEMLLGAQFKVSRGSARIDLVDKQKNHFNGFVPSLEPIAKYRGKEETSVILDFGVPLGLEFGVRLLGGKWEKSVGLFEQPSFQVKGKAPVKDCDGIDLSLVIQNYIYLSAGGLYDYAIDTTELWNKKLGCIASAGSPKIQSKRQAPRIDVQPRQADDEAEAMALEDPEDAVDEAFEDGAASTKPPTQHKVPVNASQVDSVTGYSYRLLADLNETAILVSGKDDRLYLAPYGDPDASSGSPFATEPSVSDAVILGDVFGGYINFSPEEMALTGVSNLRSSRLTKVYEGNRFISLAEVQVNSRNATAGMYVAVEARTERIYSLVTCSVIDMGTRMYIVDPAQKDIVKRLSNNELEDTIVGGPVRGCQYVYLTSGTRGLQLPQLSGHRR